MTFKPPDRRAKAHRAKVSRRKAGTAGSAAMRPVGAKSSRDKVRAFRKRMRAKGLRLVQIWLPDTRTPEFAAEANRQSLLANRSPFSAADQAWVESMSDWKSDWKSD